MKASPSPTLGAMGQAPSQMEELKTGEKVLLLAVLFLQGINFFGEVSLRSVLKHFRSLKLTRAISALDWSHGLGSKPLTSCVTLSKSHHLSEHGFAL